MSNQKTSLIPILRQFFSLERPDWLIRSGLNKGIYHDKVAINIILFAGQKIKFRQGSPDSKVGGKLYLLNDDSKTEKQAEITTQWRELVADVPSAVFVSTLYTDVAGVMMEVDFEVEGVLKLLPVYIAGTTLDSEFLSVWDETAAEYALFTSRYANILIPSKDKSAVRALSQTRGLQHLADYYCAMFEYFNHLAGVSFEADAPVNKNIPNRYFMKADKSGAGAAYYGSEWTAETNDSTAVFWLDTAATNWGSLHEVSHGYQGLFFSNAIIQLGEIWNNIFCHLYQEKLMGDDVYRNGWLFSPGEEKEKQVYQDARRVFDQGMNTAGGAGHLILFYYLLIVWRMGERGFIEFYKRYRRISNSVGFRAEDLPAMDHLSSVSIDVGNSDVSAFMDYTKVRLNQRQLIENSYSGAAPVYPLYALVSPDSIERIRDQLGLRSPLHLVSAAQLASVGGPNGTVTFKFGSEVYPGIYGKKIILKTGNSRSRVVSVDMANVVVSDLPVGVYALQLPYMPNEELQPAIHYVVVKEGSSDFDCIYVKSNVSFYADQRILLGGLSGDFCVVSVDVSRKKLIVNVVDESPHVYFKDQLYCRVTVRNPSGVEVFDREIIGDKTELFSQELPIELGFIVEIFHEEPSRIRHTGSAVSAIFDGHNKVNQLAVTDQGVVNIELGTNAGANLQEELAKASLVFDRLPHLILRDDFPLKKNFELAINSFSEPVRGQLLERYKKLEFIRPPNDMMACGDKFSWVLRGNGNRLIGCIEFGLMGDSVDIVFYGGQPPHECFSSVYVSIVVTSSTGEVLYVHELRGDIPAEASNTRVMLSAGTTVSVMHREPSRNVFEDAFQQRYEMGLVQHAQKIPLLGLSLSSYWPATTAVAE